MLKLKRVQEAKQVGILYHVCGLSSALYNIKHNSITPSGAANDRNGKKTISFTRDKLYLVDTVSLTSPILFQFVIDGDKLSENNKIAPYAAPDYSEEYSEKEEVMEGPLKDLKKFTKSLNILIIKDIFTRANPRIFKGIADSLEEMKGSGIPMDIVSISGRRNPKIVKADLPKDIDAFIALCRKIHAYDSPNIFIAINSICKQFFGKLGDVTTGKTKITVEFDEDQSLKNVGDLINAIVEIIEEELESKKPTVSTSPNKESTMSLSKLLNSKTMKIESLTVYPMFDYMTHKTPIIVLSLVKPDTKAIYINFPL